MRSLVTRWVMAARIRWLRAAGIHLPEPLYVLGSTCIRHVFTRGQRGSIRFGARAMISHGVVIESWGGDVSIGRNVFFGPHAVVYGHGGVEIGDECLIAMHCTIVSSNHALPPMDRTIQYEPDELRRTKIGRDVWLGANVTVLGGVTIGDGCVVGAGSVITKDLPLGAIAHGVPATVKGFRGGSNPGRLA